jgi:hypothetical protein
MRSLLVAAVLLLVMAGWCWAASPYEDVPADHWAYNSLDYLAQRGVLEGYPDGFFKGDRTLTRYEFAQAVARLLDTIEVNGADENVKVMAESLRSEFSDQLAEINRSLQEQGATIADLDSKVGDLESAVGDQAGQLNSLSEKIKDIKPGAKWYGIFRYRWQWDSTDYDYTTMNGEQEEHVSRTDDRFRQRVKLHLGMSKQINDKVFAAMELRTGNRTFSAYNDLGVDDQGDAMIYLHDAYIKYTPSWFGYYTGADCTTCSPRLDIYAGMFPEGNVLTDDAQMLWASDRDMHGVGIVYHYDKDFQINSFAAIIQEEADDLIDDDVWLLGAEVHKNNLLPCFDVWGALYTWRNEDKLPDWYWRTNSYTNPDGTVAIDLNGDSAFNGGDRFSTNYTNVKFGAKYTWQCVLPKPVILSGEVMCNIANDADDRIDAYNAANSGLDLDYETCDQGAWNVGVQYGLPPKEKGDWMAFAKYKAVGAAATPAGLTDPDTWVNVKNLYLYYGWMWEDNCTWGITYLASDRKNDFGGDIDPDSWQTVKCEWTFNF